jgi:hypothetical protein
MNLQLFKEQTMANALEKSQETPMLTVGVVSAKGRTSLGITGEGVV